MAARRGLKPVGFGWFGVVAVLLWCAVAGCSRTVTHDPTSATQAVEIAGSTFELELALDDDARYQGLSDRAEVPADGGMLFVFPQPAMMAFVMRRCLVDIDLIFLGPNGRVVATHAMTVEPYDTPESELTRYGTPYPAQFAIELRGGTLEELGLSPGDPVVLPLEALKARAE